MEFQPNKLPAHSEADLIREIVRVVRDEFQGKVPNSTEFRRLSRVSLNSLRRKFGGYREAVVKAGFTYAIRTYSVSRRRITVGDVKESLRGVLIKSAGDDFTYRFYRANGGSYAKDTIKSILGTDWEGALNAIGARRKLRTVHIHQVTANSQRRKMLSDLSEDTMFKELERVWQTCGKCPTRGQFDQASPFKVGLYERRFGSWSRAIAAYCKTAERPAPKLNGVPIGWTLDRKRQYSPPASKEVLREELRRISKSSTDVELTYRAYRSLGGAYCIATFQSHFGRWSNALKAVGIRPVKPPSYSQEELFSEMQRVWEHLGRQPTFSEMEIHGTISPATYHRKFGSWIKAIHAFCEDRNNNAALAAPSEPSDRQSALIVPTTADITPNSSGAASESLPMIVVHATSRNVPPKLRFRVFQRDSFTCQVCGRSRENYPELVIEADHKKAWTNGGESILSNLQTLCSECNRGKSNL